MEMSSYPSFPSTFGVSLEMIEGSHSSSSSPDPRSSEDSAASTANTQQISSKTTKRSIRSHNKTRQGCFNCKRRKVKCSEERPACIPCARNGLRCVFPLTREAASSPFLAQLAVPQAQSMRELHSGNLEFTALDMRLLHHFIISAYPHLPLNCDKVWTHDIPAMAYQYNYLMHAMLSVSASHLVRSGQHSLAPAAYFHRLKAIEGVNHALDQPGRTPDDYDALISACYSLAFQNAHIGDSPTAFWITVRSIASIGQELKHKKHPTRFIEGITPTAHASVMTSRLEKIPRVRPTILQEAILSLEALSPFCKDPTQLEYYQMMHQTLTTLFRSSLEGYFAFASIYAFIATMDAKSFARLSDPNEYILQMLQVQFLAIQTLIVPILGQEWAGRGPATDADKPKKDPASKETTSSSRWTETVCKLTAASPLRKYLDWADGVQQRAEAGTLWNDFFEPEGEAPEVLCVEDVPDTRALRAQWLRRLGLADADCARKDSEAVVKEYEERIAVFDKRVEDRRKRGTQLVQTEPLVADTAEDQTFIFYS